MSGSGPRFGLHDHSGRHPTAASDLAHLAAVLEQALPAVMACPGPESSVLEALEEVEISLLDDAAMAAVHGEFLEDPSPTDVITFHHGEILISVETAAREAAGRGDHPLRESALYAIHGLLHLHGHADADHAGRAAMQAAQERILQAVWPRNEPS